MLRTVWLGYLFGMLVLLSAVHRIALATPGADDYPSADHTSFKSNLQDMGVSSKITSFSEPLYKLFSITQLSLNYTDYSSMLSALDTNWKKETVLSSKITDQQKVEIKKLLLNTPVRGVHHPEKDNNEGLIPYSEPHQSLVIFFSSHIQPMLKNLNKLKEIKKHIANNDFFTANVLLVSSTTYYRFDELLKLESSSDLSEHFKILLRGKKLISQSDLAKGLFGKFFSWPVIDTIPFDSSQHFSHELEKFLSQTQNYEVYSRIILATFQPYCEEAKIIVTNKLKHNYSFYHSCLDFYTETQADYPSMVVIADSLNALRHWIETENKYKQPEAEHRY
ncbi:hypothetical protein [Endozoicomonas lisbonensis]